jgi:cell division inhibitor SepF
MSMWRKAMNYLGLGPDDAYYDDDHAAMDRGPQRPGRAAVANDPYESTVTVRPISSRAAASHGSVRDMPARDAESVVVKARQGSTVRTVAPTVPSTPHTVSPRSFNEAQEVGDRFRVGQPVIVNLEGLEKEVSRRIIDFTSGLCYALNGRMERVAAGVYLLNPASADADEHGDV